MGGALAAAGWDALGAAAGATGSGAGAGVETRILSKSSQIFFDGGLGARGVYRSENVRHVGYAGHGGFAPDVAPVLGMARGVADVPNLAEGAEDGAVVLEVGGEEVAPVVADDEVEIADVEHVSDVVAAGAGAKGAVVSLPAQGGDDDVRRLASENRPKPADDEVSERVSEYVEGAVDLFLDGLVWGGQGGFSCASGVG